MFLLANEIPVQLEVLDAQDNPLSSMAAMLRHLDSKGAILALPADAPAPCLHWGSKVRFSMEDGSQRFEISGAVIAHDQEQALNTSSSGTTAERYKEVWLRVWECHSATQRRATPRREVRFAVRYRSMEAETYPDAAEKENRWQQGWCLDIGGGGMRMRAPLSGSPPERLQMEFCLPSRNKEGEEIASRSFCLVGRIVRAEKCGRHRDSLDMAIRFERLSVADGLAIAAYIE